jgi:hypothetical protein
MIRQGFEFGPQNVSYPYWWSRAKDFGLLERWGSRRQRLVGQREETPVNWWRANRWRATRHERA